MAVKFSQFNAGATVADIDFIVGYKSTDNVQIPIGLVTVNTTYSIATAQDGLNESLTLTGVGPASTDVITFTAGANITLTDDGAGNGFTIQAKGSVDGTGTANVLPKWSDADTLTDSILTETAAAGLFTDPYISVAGAGGGVSTQNLEITGFLLDSNGQKGAAGQLLSSTGTLTDWVDAPSGETYDLNSTTDGANVDVNLTSTSGADNSSVKLVPAGGLTISQTGDVITLDTSASGSGTVTNVDSAVTAIPGLTLVTTNQTTTPTVTLGLAASAGANEYLDGGTGQWTALPSAGGISRLVTTDTGDGTTLIFTDITGSLTLPASNPEFNIDIYISGVYQAKASYTYTTATNGTITFASGGAPPNGAAIEYVTTT